MELPDNAMIPFMGIEIIENGTKIETQVYRKVTNTGLLLHFKGHRFHILRGVGWDDCCLCR